MGVPKFFRYISERYPCLSEIIKEYQIPGFDNLYLDMNGIFHVCSHPDDSDVTFRITEEKVFLDIFHYIEILFRMVKPQKLFFMAVDGVAPRAKMNQQRGRRFRSAKDAAKQEENAKQRNVAMPDTERFDSNCITPGTIFMKKLHEQLKYFISNKVTTDKLWQKCTVILSGHETPGEGEHKIMDYIRYARSQPGYDSNTRHCLYGLDADLIMLGLCLHEPHFSLLREEVKFGKKSFLKVSPENTTFYLLHLSMMREYLREEFISVANKINFEYNLENIIDDWVFMGFLVGNDFVPHLPNLHINHDALPLLHKTYMAVLPQLDGYLNESGTLILSRFQVFMKALTALDYAKFEETYDDLQYFKSKTGRELNTGERKSYNPRELESWDQDEIVEDLLVCLEPESNSVNIDLAALIKETADFAIDASEESSITALNKIFSMDQDVAEEKDMQIEVEFQLHKKNYYETKMHLKNLTADTLVHLSYEYIRALQWILHYYYNGLCSWSWFYPYHYAPYISDIKSFSDIDLKFDLGQPFLPYEQLLAVLPPASKESLPQCFHELMTDRNSIIKDFYPDNFETDLNGKRQEWEAVVLITFIDEKRLIEAMALPLTQLTPEERDRNIHGPMMVYRHSPDKDLGSYYAPDYFPTIQVNCASCTPLTRAAIHVPRAKLVKGICKGAAQGVYYPGFPTTNHLKYKSTLLKKKVRVFDKPSHDYNMILSLDPPIFSGADEPEICDIVAEYLGKTVFVRWPHLIEATVVGVSNMEYRYDISADGKGYNVIENQGNIKDNFQLEKSAIETYYLERRGVDVGPTNFLIHVRELVGRRYGFLNEGKIRVNLAKEYAALISTYPLQTIVRNINAHDDNRSNYQQLSDLFSDGTTCFMLGQPHYGATGKVIHCQESFDKGRIKVYMQVAEDPNFTKLYHLNDSKLNDYYSQHSAASRLSIFHGTLARITSCVLVCRGSSKNVSFDVVSKVNIGLNLKNARKSLGIPGYVKNIDSKWYYSKKCLELVDSYRNEFFAVFQHLNNLGNNDFPFEVDLFPEDKGDGTTLKKIQEWLNKQPCAAIEMQNCGSKMLETEVVLELENMMCLYKDHVRPKQIKMTVRPHLIHIPGLISGNVSADNSTTFELFDRVVNIRECYTVPVGYTGTVIAVLKVPNDNKKNDILVDVLYDTPFAGGVPLNGCSPNRGYRMSPNDLINKSHGDRKLNIQLEKRTPNYQVYKSFQPQGDAQNSAFVTWNNSSYSNNHRTNIPPSLPQNRGRPIATNLQSEPMFVNLSLNTSHAPEGVAYNSNNIPCYVPPPEANKPEHYVNNDNESNDVQLISNANTSAKDVDSSSKTFVTNEQNVQQNCPRESPKKTTSPIYLESQLVTTQLESPTNKQKPKSEAVSVKMDRLPRSNQPGTEMLRNLLRLNEIENKKFEQSVPQVSCSNSVDNFFQMAQSSRSIAMDKPVNHSQNPRPSTSSTEAVSPSHPAPMNDYPSAQLLSFFEAHGMGCPMYTYSELPGGYKAEVKIPTNRGSNMVLMSSLCKTRDDAAEDVAANTLVQLKVVDLSIFMPEMPSFPTPPSQWCSDSPSNSRSNVKNKNHGTRYYRPFQMEKPPRCDEPILRADKPIASNTGSVLNALSVPFVPLQVTRKYYENLVGSIYADATVKNNGNKSNMQATKTKASPQQEKVESGTNLQQVNISSAQQNPKPVRQMRLAANFRYMPS